MNDKDFQDYDLVLHNDESLTDLGESLNDAWAVAARALSPRASVMVTIAVSCQEWPGQNVHLANLQFPCKVAEMRHFMCFISEK